MIEKRLVEVEIRAGGDGNIVASSADIVFSGYNSVITDELQFNLVGEYGSLDFTISETSTLDITAQPYVNTFGQETTFNLYDNSTILAGIRTAQADEGQLYQPNFGYNSNTIDGGMHYIAGAASDSSITSNPGYTASVSVDDLVYDNKDNSTILNGKFSYTTYLNDLMPVDDIFINGGNHYSALPPPVQYDSQKQAGGTSVFSSSINFSINQETQLTDGMIFGTYVRPPVNYNVTADGVPITSSPQQWTF